MPLNTTLRTTKNTLMLIAGTLVRMVGSFVFVLYAASLLGVAGFGKFSLAIFYFELFLSLTATAVGILLTRDAAKWPRHLNQLFSSSVVTVSGLTVGGAALMLLLSQNLGYSAEAAGAISIAAIALFPASMGIVLEAIFVAKERAEFVTAGTTIESLLRIVLSLALLKMGYGIQSLIWVLVLVRTLLLAFYVVALTRIHPLRWSFHPGRFARFAKRWKVFAAENWMATIYTNLDVLILSSVAGEVAVGLYSAAWKVVRLGSVLSKSYTTAIFPVMSKLYGDSESRFNLLYQESIRVMCLIAIPAAVVVLVFAERIIGLLFEPEYAAAVPILRVLIWVLLIEFLNPFLSHALFARGKQHRSMHVAAISLVFNLIATLLLVYRYGSVGAAAGTVLSGLVATVCYMYFLMPKREVASTLWTTARIVVAAVGLGFILYWLRSIPLPVSGIVGGFVYIMLLFAVQGIRIEDFEMVRLAFQARTAS